MRNIILSIANSILPYLVFAQWNLNPAVNTPVCLQVNDQQEARIVTDGMGGAITTWLDFRNDAGHLSGDIFVQRIDKNGMNKWTANGVALCTNASNQTSPWLVEDGNGGAIVAWNDWRNGNRDIYAQKIDSMGVIQWNTNGIAIVSKASQQQDAKLISDGSGGAIIVWQDSANGTWDVYAQRISSSGSLLWTANGIAVCSLADAQINPRIISDGSGGGIIVWQDKRSGLDYDIYAQRVNATGALLWNTNGVSVCKVAGTQSNPKIQPDGSGGVIIAWQDKRNGLDYNIYAQRLNASGVFQWTANGVAICAFAGSQSAIDMTSEGIVGAIVSWKDDRNGNLDIYAQKINLAGALQWSTNGVAISTAAGSQLNPNVVGDGIGGAILVWQDSSAVNADIKSQRVDGNGSLQWAAAGVNVGSAADKQVSPKSISDGMGGCIYVWQDKRNTTDYDVYVHHLFSNGTPNGVNEYYSYVKSSVFPNPVSGSAAIQLHGSLWQGSMTGIELFVFDILGKEVQINYSYSENAIHISRGNMQNGIYFYELRSAGNLVSQGKLMLTSP